GGRQASEQCSPTRCWLPVSPAKICGAVPGATTRWHGSCPRTGRRQRKAHQRGNQRMAIKIAMIGAGSIGFTRRLMQDVLAVPELADTHFAFTDISERNLDMVTSLCRRDVDANGLPATIAATTDRRRALADADYVICMIRQGG